MSRFSPEQQASLQAAVLEAFDADGLAQLSRYRLGQRLDVLVAVNRPLGPVVFDLIQLVEARGWTEEFVRGVHDERPETPLVRQFCEAHARFVFAPRTATTDLARQVESGLATVASRLADPADPVRAILVGQAIQTLTDLGSQFLRLRKYKALHDCLHSLQFKYARLIPTEVRAFRDDPTAADNLETYCQEMADELAQARPESEGLESRAAEQLWLNMADESVRRMRAAVAARQADRVTAGFQLLDGVLRVQPTRINELLTGLLEHLRLDRLRDTLGAVAGPPGAEAAPLAGTAAALGALTPRLNRILADHKEWQLVDNSLHQIENELKIGSGIDLCGFLWTEVTRILGPLLERDRGAAWSMELGQLSTDLTAAFAAADLARVRGAFKRLHPRAMWFFYQADKELKAVSGELDKVGDKLGDILREIGHGN